LNDPDRLPVPITSSDPPAQNPQVIPEGALVVKAALLEEEHDFWGSSACLDLIAAALHRQGRVKAGGAAEGKP
jgi:hypothetical protein